MKCSRRHLFSFQPNKKNHRTAGWGWGREICQNISSSTICGIPSLLSSLSCHDVVTAENNQPKGIRSFNPLGTKCPWLSLGFSDGSRSEASGAPAGGSSGLGVGGAGTGRVELSGWSWMSEELKRGRNVSHEGCRTGLRPRPQEAGQHVWAQHSLIFFESHVPSCSSEMGVASALDDVSVLK